MAYNHNPLRVGFIGWGAINRRVASLLAERQSEKVSFVAVCLRDLAEAVDLPGDGEVITEPSSLAELELDIVIEAAGRAAVAEWSEAALSNAGALAVASASALCDDDLLDGKQTWQPAPDPFRRSGWHRCYCCCFCAFA